MQNLSKQLLCKIQCFGNLWKLVHMKINESTVLQKRCRDTNDTKWSTWNTQSYYYFLGKFKVQDEESGLLPGIDMYNNQFQC